MRFKDFITTKKYVVVHCDTEEKAKKLLAALNKAGKKWASGDEYNTQNTQWGIYGECTCYSNRGEYSPIDFWKERDIQVVSFDDLVFDVPVFSTQGLQNGDVLVLRDQTPLIVTPNAFVGQHYTLDRKAYDENFIYRKDIDPFYTNYFYDIVKVYRPEKYWQCSFDSFYYEQGKCVFDITKENK